MAILDLLDPVEVWKREFGAYYYGLTNTFPMFVEGKTPGIDIAAFMRASDIKTAWFIYPLEEYTLDYWELFELAEWSGFEAQLSTAEQLSQTIGIPVWDRNIPGLWIMHLEK